LALARKRRFGPFGRDTLAPELRQKQIAAMLRAGHPLDSAREIVDAASESAAEPWAAQYDDEGRHRCACSCCPCCSSCPPAPRLRKEPARRLPPRNRLRCTRFPGCR